MAAAATPSATGAATTAAAAATAATSATDEDCSFFVSGVHRIFFFLPTRFSPIPKIFLSVLPTSQVSGSVVKCSKSLQDNAGLKHLCSPLKSSQEFGNRTRIRSAILRLEFFVQKSDLISKHLKHYQDTAIFYIYLVTVPVMLARGGKEPHWSSSMLNRLI